ncbi:MAG: 16S rRNA (guanine(527)-N(7))-methyltransferase RsmG [Propionibacteriaceae bacterium]|nr:16S rRNA (guanine(527)-N(7))-methyltransferase RsmG [Propionibacteriaceae bacterium]
MLTHPAAGQVFGDQVGVAEEYAQLLATRGVEWGLIGPREVDRIWERHVLNSVAVGFEVPVEASVVDVGSGAGLPGIPLALARPDVRVTLVEPLLRRANFLTEVVEELGLADRVAVVRGRAEDHGATYDVVTARAVARLPKLLGWCAPLIGRRGRLIALKGASASDEVADASAELRRFRLTARVVTVRPYEGAEPTTLVICER